LYGCHAARLNWSYHSLHLQVAGAVAAKAAGLSVQGLLDKYLIQRVGMTTSGC
jgi:CubicO group peptidase (beta-lactamase class C family)